VIGRHPVTFYTAGRFNNMKTLLIMWVLVCVLSCGDASDTATSTDQANIQGAWLAQTESLNGIQKNVSFLYVFKGDTVNFTDETGKLMKYSFRLDTTRNPRLLIIRSADTLAKPTPVSVGYQLNGDSLKLVVAPPGLIPTEISDKNNQELIICKRKL
jgi:uncharacterized protein (TIGR03067 family)